MKLMSEISSSTKPRRLKLYQIRGRDKILRDKRAVIVLPTGTGKSEIILQVLRRFGFAVWIICPKSLVTQWRSQIDALKPPKPWVYVWSYSDFQHRLAKIKEIYAYDPPEMIVMDEPKPLKGDTQVLRALVENKIRAPYRVILDATPLENNLTELWFLFRWFAPKVFGNLSSFNEKFVNGQGSYRNMTCLREVIKPYVFRPKVEAPRSRQVFFIPVRPCFEGETLVEHEDLCKALAKQLKASSDVGSSYRAANKARGLISKLRSFLSDTQKGAAPKFAALRDLIKKNVFYRGIIFVFRRETAKAIKEYLDQYDIGTAVYDGSLTLKKREKIRTDFNSGALRFIVATSAGERGVDLPTGNCVIHFDLPWTRASYDQRDRVSRLSSDQTVSAKIITLLLKGTVEEVMWSIVVAKQKLMIEPFEGSQDDVIIPKKSWLRFLRHYLKEKKVGKANPETGENLWWTRR